MITMESKLKEVMEDPKAVEVLESMVPGISKNPALKMAYGMSLRNCCRFPQSGFDAEKTAELEERLKAIYK